jgi:probable F420-dependent oxidoreductase
MGSGASWSDSSWSVRPDAAVDTELGPYGVWSAELRVGAARALAEIAAELEELGYSAVWLPGRTDDVFDVCDQYLGAAQDLVLATGVVSIWNYRVEQVAAATARLVETYPGRFLLGLGVSHGPLVNDAQASPYRKPLALMEHYLDDLDQLRPGEDSSGRVIAALGPRMLELAERRSGGTHSYLVTPEHTRVAREALGNGGIVAVCQTGTIEEDPEKARATLRGELATYMRFPNYVNNWRRMGFGDDEFLGGGSDRLIDGLFVWGDADAVAQRMRDHLDAGASHVCFKALGAGGSEPPLAQWRRLADALEV